MNNEKTILLIGRTGNGKSTLANVITGVNKFQEGEYAVSETKRVQSTEFKEGGVKYRIIDTVGIGDTKMTLDQVLRKLALMGYSVKGGLNQILFVTDGKLAKEAEATYHLLREVIFDKDIAKYTTIVRTNFTGFRNENICKEEKKQMTANSGEEFKWLVEKCNEIIFVDNPPITGNEIEKELNGKRREDSKKVLLKHLETFWQDENYMPTNLISLSNVVGEYSEEKEELKEKESKGIIPFSKRKMKNLLLNRKITEKMIEFIGSIDPKLKETIKEKLKQLEKEKKSGKETFNPFDWKQFLFHKKEESQEAKMEVPVRE